MKRRFKIKVKTKEEQIVSTSYGIRVNYIYVG